MIFSQIFNDQRIIQPAVKPLQIEVKECIKGGFCKTIVRFASKTVILYTTAPLHAIFQSLRTNHCMQLGHIKAKCFIFEAEKIIEQKKH